MLLWIEPTPPYARHIHGAGFLVGGLGNPVAGRNVAGLVLILGVANVQIRVIGAGRVDSARRGIMNRGALCKDRFVRLH